MGSDDLFHKRKAKTEKDLARKKASRASYDKVLIVCEGEKTEPNYFNELKDHYQLNSANVVVDGRSGSDPWSIYQYAQQCAAQAKRDRDPYDKVYCVFDKDKHATYQKTLDAINGPKANREFAAIVSVPCFEYWLLLHFTYTTQPFEAAGNKSCGDQVVHELKKYLPSYQKADKGIFIELLPSLNFAKANAERALKAALAIQTDNPSTWVHGLVNYLQNLKTPQ
jgi:hypothetical protein